MYHEEPEDPEGVMEMFQVRPANERGHANHGWLEARHTFSFADYHDPRHMGFRALRVINDDIIQPAQGFGTHGHRDMEIITYVLDGALEHKDSMGSGSVLRAGDVQRMSAGRGVTHSEFNHSREDALRLLQIWILPDENGREPGYEEKNFSQQDKSGQLRLIASPDGDEGSLQINQDVRLYASCLDKGEQVNYQLAPDRHLWLQVAKGQLKFGGKDKDQDQARELGQGDGLAVSQEELLSIEGVDNAEFLLFDLN